MTKEEAVRWCRKITTGEGVDRNAYLGVIHRGEVALRHWSDGLFTLGIEYGALIALVEAFGITHEELYGDPPASD